MSPRAIEAAVVALAVGLALGAAIRTSPTADEGKHILNGLSYDARGVQLHEEMPAARLHSLLLDTERFRVDFDRVRPFGEWTVPWEAPYLVHLDEAERVKVRSRLPTVVVFACFLVLFAAWARQLFPHAPAAAITALGLCALEPAMIGHASVATADMFLAAAATAAAFALWAFIQRPSFEAAAVLAIATGGCLIVKLPGLFIAGFVLVVLAAWACHDGPLHRREGRSIRWRLGALALVAVGALVVLDAAYGFRGLGRCIANIRRPESSAFEQLAAGPFGRVPLPVPLAYVRAMDYSKGDVLRREGDGGGGYFLLGEVYPKHRLRYFPLAFLLKTSTLHLALLAIGLVGLLRRHRGPPWRPVILVGFPTMFMLVNVLFNPFDIGVRYVLPVLPFTALIGGGALAAPGGWRRIAPWIVVPLLAARAAWWYPDEIGAFNVSAWLAPRDRLLSDSNVDWGQLDYLVTRDLREHPTPRAYLDLLAVEPVPLPPGTALGHGLGPGRHYFSKTVEKLLDPAVMQLFERPVRTLGGLIDVYELSDETELPVEPVTHFDVSEVVPGAGRDPASIDPASPEFAFRTVEAPYGILTQALPEPGTCVSVRAPADEHLVGNLVTLLDPPYDLGRTAFEWVWHVRSPTPKRFERVFCSGATPWRFELQLLRWTGGAHRLGAR